MMYFQVYHKPPLYLLLWMLPQSLYPKTKCAIFICLPLKRLPHLYIPGYIIGGKRKHTLTCMLSIDHYYCHFLAQVNGKLADLLIYLHEAIVTFADNN